MEPLSIEKRLHQALKDAWPYVDKAWPSNSARSEVSNFVEMESPAGQLVPMLFAIQTAWTFVHGSGNEKLMGEFRALLRIDSQNGREERRREELTEEVKQMVKSAFECVQNGRYDEALLHLGMMETRLAKTQLVSDTTILNADRYLFLRDAALVHPEACPVVFWANKHGEAGRRRLDGHDLDHDIDEARKSFAELGYNAPTSEKND